MTSIADSYPMVDCRGLEHRGRFLRCPACSRWVPTLFVEPPHTQPVCWACHRKRLEEHR